MCLLTECVYLYVCRDVEAHVKLSNLKNGKYINYILIRKGKV